MHVDDWGVAIDVAPFERGELARAQAGLGREDDHRPVERAELRRDAVDLVAGEGLDLETSRDPPLARAGERDRVLADQFPHDSAVQHLRERAKDLRPVPVGESCLPGGHVGHAPLERPDRSTTIDAVVALAMAVDRHAYKPEPAALVRWL